MKMSHQNVNVSLRTLQIPTKWSVTPIDPGRPNAGRGLMERMNDWSLHFQPSAEMQSIMNTSVN